MSLDRSHIPLFRRFIIYPLQALLLVMFYGFVWIFPKKIASWLGEQLFRFIGPLTKKHRVAKRNMLRVYPNKPPNEHEKVIQDVWRNIGQVFGEFPHLYKVRDDMEFVGLEHIPRLDPEQAKQLPATRSDYAPAIFFSAHIANWELLQAGFYKLGLPIGVVYRPPNNPFADWLLKRVREKAGSRLVPKGRQGARQILSLLKQNHSLGMLMDQKMNNGVQVSFMGQPAMTAPALAQLAVKNNLPVVPARIYRIGRSQYRMQFFPPLSYKKTDSEKMILRKVNKVIEGWIEETPGEWLWVHNRWPKN